MVKQARKAQAPLRYLHMCYTCGVKPLSSSLDWREKPCENCESDDTYRVCIGRVWELND